MSNRQSEFQKTNPNPAERFLEWNGKDGVLFYYDKEKKEKVEVKIPFKFLVLKEMHTVSGFNDATESGIYANEVRYIGTESLTVRTFKGGRSWKGLYKDIKSEIKDAGANYLKSIYIMGTDGSIWNIRLKGACVREWGEFTDKSRSRLFDEWVSIHGTEKMKKGSINYFVPKFKFCVSLSEDDAKKGDDAYKILEDYINSKSEGQQIPDQLPDDNSPDQDDQDDLPF